MRCEILLFDCYLFFKVQENGCLQHWSYKADCKWRLLNESHICDLQGAEVTDACFNVAQNTLYWCEKRFPDSFDSPVFCIMMCRQGTIMGSAGNQDLAHLSRRLMRDLIVYQWLQQPAASGVHHW